MNPSEEDPANAFTTQTQDPASGLSSASTPQITTQVGASSAVEPFTTLTIDIWGSGPRPSGGSGSGTSDDSDPSEGSDADDDSGATHGQGHSSVVAPSDNAPEYTGPAGSSDGSGESTTQPWPATMTGTNAGSQGGEIPSYGSSVSPDQQASDSSPFSTGASQFPDGSQSFTVVTDSEVNWIPGSNGPTQVTVLSEHTIALPQAPTDSPTGASSITILGPDGVATVLELPEGGVGSPVTSSGGFPGVSGVPGPDTPSGASSITILGPDGVATVLELPDGGVGSPVTSSGGFPWGSGLPGPDAITSGITMPPATFTGPADGAQSGDFPSDGEEALTVCTSYTIVGPDGLPTVIETSYVASQVPMTEGPNGWPASGVPEFPGSGIVASTSYTIIGPDGKPTVVESSWTISPTEASGGALTSGALPTITDGAYPGDGYSGNAYPGEGVTTCTSFTVLGPDGVPTVVESSWVISPTDGSQITPGSPSQPFPTGYPGSGYPGDGSPDGGYPGDAVTTCTSYTVLGPDGVPTIVESSWVISPTDAGSGPFQGSAALPFTTGGVGSGYPGSGYPSSGLPSDGSPNGGYPGYPGNAVTTCATFTSIGADGYPTVVESTFVVPGPVNTGFPLPQGTVVASDALPTGTGPQITPAPGFPLPGGINPAGSTTCTSYTYLGPDGMPTVVETTWAVPGPWNTQGGFPGASGALPTGYPGQVTNYPGEVSGDGTFGGEGVTTCATYTYLGADGQPSVVETSWIVAGSAQLPAGTSIGYPSLVPAMTNIPQLPQGIPGQGQGSDYTATTVMIDGPNGPVPVVVSVPVPAQMTPIGVPFPPGPVVPNGDLNSLATFAPTPSLSAYGDLYASDQAAQTGVPASAPGFPLPGDGSAPGSYSPVDGTTTQTLTSIVTVITGPGGALPTDGAGASPPSYGSRGTDDSAQLPGSGNDAFPSEITLWPASPVYGTPISETPAVSTPCLTTTLRTDTWTNIIPEQLTTYTMKFPFTTMATVTAPALRRGRRRQER